MELLNAGALRMVWGVGALVQAVGEAVAARFGAVTVQGELSGYTRAASGHAYFNLKDAMGQPALIRCAMFRRAGALLDFTPVDGQRVELRGRLGVFEPRGELQFVVEAMQRCGQGSLFERFLHLKQQLQEQGLFDAARKRPWPAHLQCLGVVTSLAGAALHDVAATLARRAPHVRLHIYPSLVQGDNAPAELVAAIGLASQRAEIDALLVARGGGSLEDLWAFNDERVVRAIAACAVPVMCGIGHETDVTLAEFAADVRAPTPTAAAELAVSPTAALRNDVQLLDVALRRRVQQWLEFHAQRLDRSALRLARPADALRSQRHALQLLSHRLKNAAVAAPARQAQRLQRTGLRLTHAASRSLLSYGHHLAQWATRLQAVDPKAVTKRGYAWLVNAEGLPVQHTSQLVIGQTVKAVLADGEAQACITALHPRLPS